jgi:hypothetical protein
MTVSSDRGWVLATVVALSCSAAVGGLLWPQECIGTLMLGPPDGPDPNLYGCVGLLGQPIPGGHPGGGHPQAWFELRAAAAGLLAFAVVLWLGRPRPDGDAGGTAL